MATTTQTPSEEGQLAQTIEMFEVITQSQPLDCQSLEILKEAYLKLGRDRDVARTSRRIAQAHVELGQLSSAILEYETVLQRFPDDVESLTALKNIEARATSAPQETDTIQRRPGDTARFVKPPAATPTGQTTDIDDGRKTMHKLFVESKLVTAADFNACWPAPNFSLPATLAEPFIQSLSDKGAYPIEKSLRLLCDKSRAAYLPLQLYDMDMDLARSFPGDICKRWCVLPFDRMSKSVLVATANPFNQQAAKELAAVSPGRLLWYLVPPIDLVKTIQKIYR
jgi:hypothetical protein